MLGHHSTSCLTTDCRKLVSIKYAILPNGRVVRPRELMNSADSVWDDGSSIYTAHDQYDIVHVSGLYLTEPGNPDSIQPDDQGFLSLMNHPLRVKFREVKDVINMDTMASLINLCKSVHYKTYKIRAVANQQPCNFNNLGDRIIKLDEQLIKLEQAYELNLR